MYWCNFEVNANGGLDFFVRWKRGEIVAGVNKGLSDSIRPYAYHLVLAHAKIWAP